MTDALIFQRSDEGLADFGAYLEESRDVPAYLLLDLVEEEYRRETVPHVLGGDRKNVIKYRVERAFRDTPYWHGVIQGREAEGRRDDRLLLAAVTNPALVKPWVDRLLEHKVPLAGIHSLPLVSASLLPVVGASASEVLLVSLQSTGNLRQSYFLDRQLKLSRLAHMPLLAPEGVVETTIDEVEKLRRYLNSLRLLGRDAVLQVYVIAHGPVMEELRRQCASGPTTAYHLVDIAQLAERLGMSAAFVTPYADAVYAHQLLAERPPNHYAQASETRYHSLFRARTALRTGSVLLLVGGLLGGGLGLTEGFLLERRATAASQQADFYKIRYEEARGDLPPTPIDATDLEAVVKTTDALATARATPLPALAVVSRALDAYPELQVDLIEWRADADPNAGLAPGGARAAAPPRRGQPAEPDAGKGPFHIALVRGRIQVPEGGARVTLETLRGFVETLKGTAGVHDVRVLEQPVSVSSSESLRGDLKGQAQASGRGEFVVRVALRGSDASA
jgi:hypothetical protein